MFSNVTSERSKLPKGKGGGRGKGKQKGNKGKGDLLLDTDCLTDACLDVGAGSMPEAWTPEPMVIDPEAEGEHPVFAS